MDMIRGFANRDTEAVWNGIRSRRLPVDVQRGGLRKLRWINRARSLMELRMPPGIVLRRFGALGRVNGRSASMINGAFALSGATEELRMSRSSTTTRRKLSPDLLPNPHPGEILLEDFLKPAGLSQNALARAIGVSPRRINEIVLGKRAVTADTDLRLARFYGVSEGIFLGLQNDYDLMEQRRALGKKLDAIKPRAA